MIKPDLSVFELLMLSGALATVLMLLGFGTGL